MKMPQFIEHMKIEKLIDLLRRATANNTHKEVAVAIAKDWNPLFKVNEKGKIEIIV